MTKIIVDAHNTKKEIFLGLYDECVSSVFRYCYIRLGNRGEAKSLTKKIFDQTWLEIAEHGQVIHLRALLFHNAHNFILGARVRRDRRFQQEVIAFLMKTFGFKTPLTSKLPRGFDAFRKASSD